MDMMETALVVDDDFLMRGYTVESLQKEGIFVIEASTGEEARRLQASQRFDLVFADLEIFEAAGKGFKLEPDAIHIVMTSFRTVEKAIQSVGNGAYDYLVKPFSAEQVSVIVSRTRELLKLRAQIEMLEKKMDHPSVAAAGLPTVVPELPAAQSSTTNLQDLERQTIIRVLHETRGSRSVMAEMLGISVRTLRNKLTRYKQEASLQLP